MYAFPRNEHRIGKNANDHRIPMTDSIILATARKHNATLWTRDEDFIGLDGIKYFPKK
ncbi:DUF5615 family PIN-like protein [Leptospira wolffii]|uniref:DUF5615 family PIN-like protein n=1 Tax=Leptospira wolffii TaxID=409998 RepID=UPI0039EFAE51